jgi:hypothetical protein
LFGFPDWRQNWKAAILTQFRWSRQNCRRHWTLSHNMTSRSHLKNGRSAENDARKGNTSRVSYIWPDGSTSPENYGWLFAYEIINTSENSVNYEMRH